jgi:hypothetical protein
LLPPSPSESGRSSSSTIFALSLRMVTHNMIEAITTFPNPSNPITSHSDIIRCYYHVKRIGRLTPD